MKRVARIFLVFLVAAIAAGCGESRRGGGAIIRGVCRDGDLRPCNCPDGTMSSQVCMDDVFSACACNSTTDSGVNNNTPGDASTQNEDAAGDPPDSTTPADSGIHDAGVPPDAGMSNIGQACTFSPDSCAPSSVCTQEPNGTNTTCRAPGFAQLGQSCDAFSNNCAVGQGTCVDLGVGPRCYVGCNGQTPCPQGGTICWLVGEAWGACDLYQICDPLMPSCPSDRVCTLAQSDGTCACTAAGSAQRGQTCAPLDNNCAPGQGICLNVGDGPICYQACDPNSANPGCITGTCAALTGIPWGICY